MDELAKALAEAVKSGSALAPMALRWFFFERILWDLLAPAAWVAGVWLICSTLRYMVNVGRNGRNAA